MSRPGPLSERALILAPSGRDAEVAELLLREAGRPSFICSDMSVLVEQLEAGSGLAIVADEALGAPSGGVDVSQLATWIDQQPSWSDFPFVVLTRRGGGLERNPVAGRLSQMLGNVSFVERPFHPTTFISAVMTALRARRRQYEARARIEELHESEAHYRHTVAFNPQVTWTATPDGELDHAAERWLEWTGRPGVGSGWIESIHPEDLASSAQAWSRSVQTGEPYDVEHRVHMRDGSYRWARSRAFPRRDEEQGYIVKWYGTTEDIHERKLAEQARSSVEDDLRRLNETLEAQVAERTRERDNTWRNSTDLLLVCTPDGEFRALNPAWTTLLGYPRKAMLGQRLDKFVHPEDVERSVAAMRSASIEPLAHFENRFRHHDGSFRWLAWTATPEDGLIYANGRDVTSEKEQAAALARTEDQLRQAQKMEAVGQLTGGIAHDFNNLLQGIVGSLEIVKKRILQGRTSELDRFVASAMTSANRAAALTHRLLAFSRRQPLDPKPVLLNQLVVSMEDLLRRTVGERYEVQLVLGAGLWSTLCDPNQLESALLNLAINARDAMEQGGKLTIETCNAHLDHSYAQQQGDVRPGQYVCLSVSDTGIGMPKDVIARAFEPFFTTKPIGHGTGLGLSMVYGFARQSEGAAVIYSEVGLGTTVKLFLPRNLDAAETEQEVAQRSEMPQADGEAVLIVEDEPVVRGLIVELVADLGYNAIEAADGLAGLQALRSDRRIDLLVTDIGLPGMNGREVAAAGRIQRPGLKVLFMTGYAENAAMASGFLEPGMGMITKPFALEVLAERMRDMLERV